MILSGFYVLSTYTKRLFHMSFSKYRNRLGVSIHFKFQQIVTFIFKDFSLFPNFTLALHYTPIYKPVPITASRIYPSLK